MKLELINNQMLNAVFSLMNNLDSVVLWACSPDSKQQLYLSSAYENIWGRTRETLQNHPLSWYDTIVPEDISLLNSETQKRQTIHNYHYSIPIRIFRPDGEIRYLKNNAYLLECPTQKRSIVIGVDELLTPESWHNWQKNKNTNLCEENLFAQDLIKTLANDNKLHLSTTKSLSEKDSNKQLSINICIDGKSINVTKREAECLQYLLSGLSAKQTAYKMNLSTRTIEAYLDNVRKKTNCRTKLALIGKIQKINLYA